MKWSLREWWKHRGPGKELDRYLAACERGNLKRARRIYYALDLSAQRQADRLLAEQNAYHLEQATLAQERADFYRRLRELLRVHGVKTTGDLPADIRDQVNREAEAAGLVEY
jgi:hypothetical protein